MVWVVRALVLGLSFHFSAQAAEEKKTIGTSCEDDQCYVGSEKAPQEESEIGKKLPDNWTLRHKLGYYGGGFFLGVPTKGSLRGIIFKTMEMQILLGKYPGDDKYIGHAVGISTDNEEVFNQFNLAAESEEPYVFEYKYPHPLNPEIEETHYQIVAIHPLKKNFAASHLPHSVQADHYRSGGYSEGERQGRIIEVSRWRKDILASPICIIELEIGGTSSGAKGLTANTEDMVVYGEHACRWAEAILQYGDIDVTVGYKQDYFEVWHYEERFVTTMSVAKERGPQVSLSQQAEKSGPTLEELEEALLNDPQFISRVKQKLKESGDAR